MGGAWWVAAAPSPEDCHQALWRAGEKALPAQLTWGLGASANQAMGLPETLGMTPGVPAK